MNRDVPTSHRKNKINGVIVVKLKALENLISTWEDVSVHPHLFGGKEFRFGKAEIGDVHIGGIVDIAFPRPIRDALLSEGLAEEGFNA